MLRFFFLAYNFQFFPKETPSTDIIKYAIAGLRFDLSAIAYINAIYLLSEILTWFSIRPSLYYFKKCLFFIPNFIAITIEISDTILFGFQTRRIVFTDLALINNTLGMMPIFLLRYWYVTIVGLFIVGFAWKKDNAIWKRLVQESINKTTFSINIFIKSLVISLLVVLLATAVIIIGRGGIQNRPINNLTAAMYVNDVKWIPFVLNSTFSFLSTSQRKGVTEQHYFEEKKLDSLFTLQRHFQNNETFRPLNVVIIVLESFGKEYSSKYNDYQGFTPFLDSLSNYSFTTTESYANALRSSYGIVAITASIPTMMEEAFMFSPYQNNKVSSLSFLLKDKGYKTAFFHGSVAGSMGFDKYSKAIGYDIFGDRTDYPNQKDFDGQWGIFDRPYFQYVAERFNQMPQPFHGLVFSLSSHEPFKVESDFEEQHKSLKPLYRSVLYTDDALRRFFQTAQKMPWFEQTLFVITADHTGLSEHEEYLTGHGKYKVPILFYCPKDNLKGNFKGISQQIDILPSVLDYLHYDKPFSAFGRSIFNQNADNYAFMYNYGRYFIIDEKYVLGVDLGKEACFYDYQNDPNEKENLIGKMPEKEKPMLDALLARIQRHHKAMIYNQLRE